MQKLFENWRHYINERKKQWSPWGKGTKPEALINFAGLPVIDASKFRWGKLKKYSKRSVPPKIIVIHTGGATPPSTASTLNKNGYSTNFEVDLEGRIYMYLDPSEWATWHAGNTPVNQHSIGIDISGNGRWTSTQVASTKDLVSALSSKYDIPQVVAPDPGFRLENKSAAYYLKPCPGQKPGQPADCRGRKGGVGKNNVANFLINNNIGIVRHRNVVATRCPGDFPVDELGTPYARPEFDQTRIAKSQKM